DVVTNPASPLLNRATLALYQPGGAIEPVIIAGALQARLATAAQTFAAADVPVTFDGQSLACREPPAQHDLTLTDALALGCPAPAAGLGLTLGAPDLAKLFTQFQLFSAPTFSLPTIAPKTDQAAVFTNTALAGIGQA